MDMKFAIIQMTCFGFLQICFLDHLEVYTIQNYMTLMVYWWDDINKILSNYLIFFFHLSSQEEACDGDATQVLGPCL